MNKKTFIAMILLSLVSLDVNAAKNSFAPYAKCITALNKVYNTGFYKIGSDPDETDLWATTTGNRKVQIISKSGVMRVEPDDKVCGSGDSTLAAEFGKFLGQTVVHNTSAEEGEKIDKVLRTPVCANLEEVKSRASELGLNPTSTQSSKR